MSTYEPSREVKRIAEWLIAMGQGGLAKDLLSGKHWEWNPRDVQARRSLTARTGPKR